VRVTINDLSCRKSFITRQEGTETNQRACVPQVTPFFHSNVYCTSTPTCLATVTVCRMLSCGRPLASAMQPQKCFRTLYSSSLRIVRPALARFLAHPLLRLNKGSPHSPRLHPLLKSLRHDLGQSGPFGRAMRHVQAWLDDLGCNIHASLCLRWTTKGNHQELAKFPDAPRNRDTQCDPTQRRKASYKYPYCDPRRNRYPAVRGVLFYPFLRRNSQPMRGTLIFPFNDINWFSNMRQRWSIKNLWCLSP